MLDGHGDDIYQYGDIRINFSSNVYNHFSHDALFAHLGKVMPSVCNYPDATPHRLELLLARNLGVEDTQVMATNGATEAIYLIAQCFRRSRSYVLIPTFSEYEDASIRHEHRVGHLLSLDAIPKDADLVWVCNPNNPTGMVLDRDYLLDVVDRHPDTTFILDASYAAYTQEPVISASEAPVRENLIMLFSMTKDFGVPGLRLGYAVAASGVIESLVRMRMPWSVNALAEAAGCYLLEHARDYRLPRELLNQEREHVRQQLESMGVIEVWPSRSHMLLCRLRYGSAALLKEYLAREHGILIRDASNFQSLDAGFFRIAVQTPRENDELLNAIEEWIAC